MLNFEEIKKIRIPDVLGRYGIALRYRGEWANAPCPLPTHKAGDKARSFTVNVRENYWRCFSESCNEKNAGRKGGDVINLVALLENCREREAAQKLADWFLVTSNKKAPHIARPLEEPLKEPSQKDSPDHNPPSDSGKLRYMEEIDAWFDALFGLKVEAAREEYWQKARNGVKAKLIESYKNGKNAKNNPAA